MCIADKPVKLTRYAPGLRQRPHTHDKPHFSVVLAGAFEEETGRTDQNFTAGRLAFRPEGLRHCGSFGGRGTLILTCTFAEHASALTTPFWSAPLPRERLRALIPILLEGGEDAVDAGWDLIALAQDQSTRAAPSDWVRAVRDLLLETPGAAKLGAIAERSGRHRVHLGRAFLAAFGETPSAFRRRSMLDHALSAMTRGVPAASAAAEAGFADQSHLSRVCRETFGVPPRRLAQPNVASIQDGAA